MNSHLLILNNFFYQIDSLFYDKNNINYKIVNTYDEYQTLLESDELSKYQNISFIIDDTMFDSIAKTGNPFDTSNHSNYEFFENNDEIFFKNIDIFSKKFSKPINTILYSNVPELHYYHSPIKKYINQWLEMNSTNYLISSKYKSIIHPQASPGLMYLPLIYGFYEQNFNKYPKLDYARPTHADYNFITFLGHSQKPDKIEKRFNFLKELFKDNINQIKYEKLSEAELGIKYFEMPVKSGHEWNLLQSLSVKVQLIFETINPLIEFKEDYYFSEKTMKLFLLPHPYFLLVHGSTLIELEKFGFKFPIKCFTLDDYVNNVNIILNNVDEWIDTHSDSFYHNQTHFYNLINSDTLPHHLFIKSIILK
jgi:hypothetical protein